MEAYTTVKCEALAEFTEKKSRFIGAIKPVKTEAEAAEFLASIRSRHWNANHNCYAYALRGNIRRYNDDGEPHGTAGMPILDVLHKEQVMDAAIVVTRYFGGTLLGTGGLVRAYSRAAKLALEAAGKLLMQPCTLFSLTIPYPLYDRVNLFLQSKDTVILASDFGAAVALDLRIPTEKLSSFSSELTEITNGEATPVILGEDFA